MSARQAFAYGKHSKAVRQTLYAAPDLCRPILGRHRVWRFGFEHCAFTGDVVCAFALSNQQRLA